MPSHSRFQMRNFTTLLLTLSALTAFVSGVVLYVMPEGRIAYWNNWRLLGLGKEEWGAVHTILCLVFFVAALVHLCYNWRVFIAYLRDRLRRTLTLRRELAAALALTVLCLHGSIAGYPPFSQVMELGKTARKAWYAGRDDVQPPLPHAELLPLKQLTRKVDVSLDGALAWLREQGLAATGDSTLKDLSVRSGQSPAQLFEAMMLDDRLYR